MGIAVLTHLYKRVTLCFLVLVILCSFFSSLSVKSLLLSKGLIPQIISASAKKNPSTENDPKQARLTAITNQRTIPIIMQEEAITITNQRTIPIIMQEEAITITNQRTIPIIMQEEAITITNQRTIPIIMQQTPWQWWGSV